MGTEDRRLRERSTRHRLILDTARALAEREGWEAVTTRRLAAEIEYSQPVIYKHFASLDDLTEAVALEGFGELAEALGQARRAAGPGDAVHAVARAYTAFAAAGPALYDAMFTRATRLRFGGDDIPEQLAAGYIELHQAVATIAGDQDVETLTEVFWAALHGLTALTRNQRLRPGHEDERIDLLVSRLRG
ncbi:TetR family transcriptional regulator [Kineosporia sp. NBRC 101677]|uniref:TetR/AcrR family transcriptional regulator n=1 Tax=Kineosporia sp. NBRC 101677 TaxID=3032197 RepID=UPI0024A1CA68|nr:TetR/AcrR family transcriptional regulator [Kineosporia sp. NBRC 101677]GLY15203.1 TetR family transcriptional regulator [Kineosporia sp. NBRC 101677]